MCNDREKLIAYLYDEASASERRQMDAHLADCSDCRDELRGFRSVQQDLLAWDVPEYQSVWKPFVSTTASPWWKQVPAWGLAAAATLIFGVGLAGGVAGRALFTAVLAQPPVQAQASPTPVSAPAATPEQVRQLEARLASLERTANHDGPNASPANVSTVSLTHAELEQLLTDTESRVNKRTSDKLYRMMLDLDKQRTRDLQAVSLQINAAQQTNNANLYRVATRGTLEKDKE